MSLAYPDWSPDAEPESDPKQTGATMAAFLSAHRIAEPQRDRWKSAGLSLLGHGVLLYILIFVSFALPKKTEMQTITVSIMETKVSDPEPPIVPKLEKAPEIVLPNLPQMETAAPPSPNGITVAPPSPPKPTDGAKESQDTPISPPVFDAGYLNNPAPVYPNMSRRLREVGTVQLRVRVGVTGEPLEIQLDKSSGYARLDDSARTAVQKWKFEPAKRNGNPVEAWVIVPVEFSLTRK